MNFRDQWATNNDGERFIFTVEMQRQLFKLGLPVEPASLQQLQGSAPAAVPSRPKRPERTERPERPERPVSAERERPRRAEPEEPEAIQVDPMTGKFVGRMKYYNKGKGYGFIARGGGETIFFHRSQVIGDPEHFEEGAWLLYEAMDTARGQEAFEVELYDRELAT